MDPNAALPQDVNRGTGLAAVGWLECALGTILIFARAYTRLFLRKNMGWDDWTMILAWALAVATTAIVQVGVDNGIGRHVQYVMMGGLGQAEKALEMTWIVLPFSTMSACFGKISVALLLLRLLDPNLPRAIFLWFIMVSLFIVNLLLTIITFAQCTPASYLWQRLDPTASGSCWSPSVQADLGLFQGAYSAFTDFVLALVPLFAMWTLQIPLRRKIGIMVILSLGIIAGAAAIAKTAELPTLASPDFTWVPVELSYWYLTENWLIIIAGCAPTVRPLITEIATKIQSLSSGYASRIHRPGKYRLSSSVWSPEGASSQALRDPDASPKKTHRLVDEELGSLNFSRSESDQFR